MAKAMVDIEQVRPNVWVVLDERDPEGGTIVRRFERWTCTCGDADCRHVTTAQSLVAKAAVVAENGDDRSEEARGRKIRARANSSVSEDAATVDGTITFTPLPPTRRARAVQVSDRSVLRVAGKEVAA